MVYMVKEDLSEFGIKKKDEQKLLIGAKHFRNFLKEVKREEELEKQNGRNEDNPSRDAASFDDMEK